MWETRKCGGGGKRSLPDQFSFGSGCIAELLSSLGLLKPKLYWDGDADAAVSLMREPAAHFLVEFERHLVGARRSFTDKMILVFSSVCSY